MASYTQRDVHIVPVHITGDEATTDGVGRKTLTPYYVTFFNVRARGRNFAWARQLLGYVPQFSVTEWPQWMSESQRKTLVRQTRSAALEAMLKPFELLAETGVFLPLPGKDGVVRWRVCVPAIAMASFDHKEAMGVLHVRNSYKAMPAFCHLYGLFIRSKPNEVLRNSLNRIN